MGRGKASGKGGGDRAGDTGTDHAPARLDRWLWSVRLFKTRSVAAGACRKSRVKMAGSPLKASKIVRPGEVYEVGRGSLVMTVKVLGLPPGRVAAGQVPDYLEDLTPPEQYREAARRSREQREHGAAERLTVRPTKRDLREIRRWLGQEEETDPGG